MHADLTYHSFEPELPLADFVDSFWNLQNTSATNHDVIILPDGRIDLILSAAPDVPPHLTLVGLGTEPSTTTIAAGTRICAISFHLPAVEYVLHQSVASLLDTAINIPMDAWDFPADSLQDFDQFCNHAIQHITALLPQDMDSRKQQLFRMLYASNGDIGVGELADKVFWSSRQINRYFRQQFGVTLKAYCNMLRFRASFAQLKRGQLFPETNFADQAHFIKEIRKYSGTVPKELFRNENGRFIQFSVLPG